jgi:hypothetical protein
MQTTINCSWLSSWYDVVWKGRTKWCAPKLLKSPKGGFHNETTEEGKRWGTLFNLHHFGEEGVLELQNGTRTNSQSKVQDEVNLHNQEKKAVNGSWMEVIQ